MKSKSYTHSQQVQQLSQTHTTTKQFTRMTVKQFKLYQAKKMKRLIKKLDLKYKNRGKVKAKKKKVKKAEILTFDKLPKWIRERKEGSFKPPRYIHKKYSKPIAEIMDRVSQLQKIHRTGKTLAHLEEKASTKNPFKALVELQSVLDNPEKFLDSKVLAQKPEVRRAMYLAQMYHKRMSGGEVEQTPMMV